MRLNPGADVRKKYCIKKLNLAGIDATAVGLFCGAAHFKGADDRTVFVSIYQSIPVPLMCNICASINQKTYIIYFVP